MELSVTSRKMVRWRVKGLAVCKCAAGPVTTQTRQATVYAEPTGTDTKQSEASNSLYYFHLRALCEVLPSISCPRRLQFLPSLLCFPILKGVYASNWMVLSERMPDLLEFITSYQFMHALEFAFRSLHWHKGKKKKCCIRINGFSC